jgi:hypothetical protein
MDGAPLAGAELDVVAGTEELVEVLPVFDDDDVVSGDEVVGTAAVVGAAEVVGAADVVGAGALIGLVSVSPVMIGDVGSGSTGVPWRTASMNAFQMWPGRPDP